MLEILKKRKLRVDILTLFLTLFFSTILVIIYYFHDQSSKAILKMGNNLIETNNQAIVTKLNNFLKPTPLINISTFLLSDNYVDIRDMNALSSFMHILLLSHPQLINVYIADTYGNIFYENNVTQNIASKQLIPFINNKNIPPNTIFLSQSFIYVSKNKTLLTLKYKNEFGTITKVEKKEVIFDPRTRPWYIGAIKQFSVQEPWLGVYKFVNSNEYGLTFSFPIFIKNKLVGVAAADLDLDLIANELKKHTINSHSIVFIANNHEKVIAQTENQKTHEFYGDLLNIRQLNNPLITTAYDIHTKMGGKRHFIFTYDDINYIAYFTAYAFNQADSWEIASITPVNAFIGTIKQTHKNIVYFSLVMLILGSIFVFIFSFKISRPIMRLAEETKDIVKLRFEKTRIKTHIYEVQVMIDALNATKTALSSFVKYVPKTLVAQLLKSGVTAQVGGKKRAITILFTDINNFTEMTEQTDPELLMIHLSEYLNTLTHCIQQHHGNIDKYIGDAIMAFWGAPLKDSHHIIHACQATLACQYEIRKMNKHWLSIGKPPLYTRFGLNSGTAIIGNMGSADRLNYTALGDPINLTSRLITLNKTYQTEIIVSESIYEAASDKFLFRPLDMVQVRGKHEFTRIYELIAAKSGEFISLATPEQIELCELSWAAYEKYNQKDFQGALTLFKEILNKFPQDGMAQIYIKRCEEQLGKSL